MERIYITLVMNKKIRLLILERSEKEIKPILKELKNFGYSPE